MKILHIVPGFENVTNGMSVVARLVAKNQINVKLLDLLKVCKQDIAEANEIWIHGMWHPRGWVVAWWVQRANKRLVRMPHGSLSPIYLKFSAWKKRLVGPIERWSLRRCEWIVATCEAEKGWIQAYLGKKCPKVEVVDVKRFFKLRVGEWRSGGVERGRTLHLLYLGRRHPLKGVEYLEQAVKELVSGGVGEWRSGVELKIVSNAFGEEKERVWEWCDVLVLPTLSDNFGLVVAEALERGKRVITTDGAPAWDVGDKGPEVGVSAGYGGRLLYLKGYRDGTREMRVGLLKKAIEMFLSM